MPEKNSIEEDLFQRKGRQGAKGAKKKVYDGVLHFGQCVGRVRHPGEL